MSAALVCSSRKSQRMSCGRACLTKRSQTQPERIALLIQFPLKILYSLDTLLRVSDHLCEEVGKRGPA